MIVDSVAYVIEMLKVYACVIALVFLFPRFMWRDYLKQKPLCERFLFCLITQTCFLINLVLLLGWLKICSRITLLLGLLLEYVVVHLSFSDRQFLVRLKEKLADARLVLMHRHTRASWRRTIKGRFVAGLGRIKDWDIWKGLWHHPMESLFLCGVLCYNAWFLTHQVRIYHCYQFSDLPVHISWVYALEQGTLFVDGIYPFGMHAMIYCIRAVFGLPCREIVLYFGSFQTLMTILCMYLFSKKLFRWKYSPCFVVLFFSIMLNQGRYAASLPQECGLFAFFSMGYYLLVVLQRKSKPHLVQGDSRLRGVLRTNQYRSRMYLDYPMFLLALCVALVIEFHFYTAIAAIILAFSIAVAWCFRFFKKQYFVPIVTMAIVGAVIAIVPFIACFARGIPFQDSMGWAMSLVTGDDWEGSGEGYLESLEEEEDSGTDEDGGSSGTDEEGSSSEAGEESTYSEEEEEEAAVSLFQRGLSPRELIHEYLVGIGDYSNAFLLGWTITVAAKRAILITLISCAIFLLIPSLRGQVSSYLIILIYGFIVITMGCAKMFGFTVIYEPTRASVFLEPFYFLLLAIPVDVLFSLLEKVLAEKFRIALVPASYLLCGAAGFLLVKAGVLHNFFDVNLAYYNEPDYLIGIIQKNFEPFSYTIVSPTDEYYAVVTEGYHTELSELVNMVDGNEKAFKIPTPYVFFFIEKYTLQDYFKGQAYVSASDALEDFYYRASDQDYYYQRNTLESKAYYWAEQFAKIYPNQMKIYYEDDIYIAYLLTQNENSPLDLQIDYLKELEGGAADGQ
jgi:hypothetical protein